MDDIVPTIISENLPWLNPKPTFHFEITQHKKEETNPLLIQQHFAENALYSWQDSLFLRSKSEGTASIDQMSHMSLYAYS